MTSLNQGCQCQEAIQDAGQCNANHPLALINLQQKYASERQVRKVRLQSVAFTNMFTNYNSIIGFDAVSGLAAQVEIADSSFSLISMCGAVLNSFIQVSSNKNFPHPLISTLLTPPPLQTQGSQIAT